jgi:hypothetical protein
MSSNLPGFFQGADMPTAGWWEALWPDPAGVLAAVGVTPGMEVVDLCPGDGWFTLQIAKIAAHVVAIDIDPDLLDVSPHRLSESGVTNCDYVEPRGPSTESRLSPEQTIEAVESAGLKLAHLVEVPPYHYGAVFEQPVAREQ